MLEVSINGDPKVAWTAMLKVVINGDPKVALDAMPGVAFNGDPKEALTAMLTALEWGTCHKKEGVSPLPLNQQVVGLGD